MGRPAKKFKGEAIKYSYTENPVVGGGQEPGSRS